MSVMLLMTLRDEIINFSKLFVFSPIRINLDTMYDNLPRSLTQQQLLVKTKVETDPEVLEKRREIVATKKPSSFGVFVRVSSCLACNISGSSSTLVLTNNWTFICSGTLS